MFKGKLTYGLAALAIIGAIAARFMGIIGDEEMVQWVWGGLAAFGIRRAISK
jgi:hypothetical protein